MYKRQALERLAWLTATHTLALPGVAHEEGPRLTLPILARLADYQGAADLLPLLRGAYNAHAGDSRDPGRFLGENSLRLLLWRTDNVRFVLLLDGLNEFDQAHRTAGTGALRRHAAENAHHIVHLTCRTADFDPAAQSNPATAIAPGAGVWIVQPLEDAIGHWDDKQGHSDVRDYLRRHLGEAAGKRLYERIHADDPVSYTQLDVYKRQWWRRARRRPRRAMPSCARPTHNWRACAPSGGWQAICAAST